MQKLFSQERLQSYKNQEEHLKNFFLIGKIAPAIGMLEVMIRNTIDFVLSNKSSLWIYHLPKNLYQVLKINIQDTNKKCQIISSQSLGFWLYVVEHYKIHNQIFDTNFLDVYNFKSYYSGNRNRFKSGKKLQNYQKAILILHLFRNLRNRAFHFENLYKFNDNKRPRLSAVTNNKNQEKYIVNLQTDKIELFLYDLLKHFDEDIADKLYKRVGEKHLPELDEIITQFLQNTQQKGQ